MVKLADCTGVEEVGERGILNSTRRDSCITTGSTSSQFPVSAIVEDKITGQWEWWWWWLFPRFRGFSENVRPFIPCLRFISLKWRLARAH